MKACNASLRSSPLCSLIPSQRTQGWVTVEEKLGCVLFKMRTL